MNSLLTALSLTALTLVATHAYAEIPMAHAINLDATVKYTPNSEITDMIAAYSKATGQKFVIDPGVRGKVTTLIPTEIKAEEAFNILCESLSLNGYSIIAQNDTYIVKSARNAQRDAIPTVTQVPPSRPMLMVTYVLKLKYISAEEVNKRLRILPSKDGEMTPYEPTNSIIISDYTPNLNRIAEVIAQLDTPDNGEYEKAHPRPPRPNQVKMDEPKLKK